MESNIEKQENQGNQNNQLAPQQPGESKPLSILKVSLFEVLFVGIMIVLLFGTLNFFNILRLSEIFPNQLGFLPRRDVPTGTSPHRPYQQSQQSSNLAIVPTVSLLEPPKETLMNAQSGIL